MPEAVAAASKPWSTFYFLTGSAAANLTGIMFVVITLIDRTDRARTRDGLRVFTTPTVLHFAGVLFISASMLVPWSSFVPLTCVLVLVGGYGLAHLVVVAKHAKRMPSYEPDVEDWIAYTTLPIAAYVAIVAGGLALLRFPEQGVPAIACGAMLLAGLGIRNAWDVVTFIVTELGEPGERDKGTQPSDDSHRQNRTEGAHDDRSIKTLHNFTPPATTDEIEAAARQYVRKISGASKPAKANEVAIDRAVDGVIAATRDLLASLVTTAPPRDRECEAIKARVRFAARRTSTRAPS